jgi:hypothetical protein
LITGAAPLPTAQGAGGWSPSSRYSGPFSDVA